MLRQVILVACILGTTPLIVAALCGQRAVQLVLMLRLLKAPRERAAWYNATGTTLYVLGMLVSAFCLRSLAGAAAAVQAGRSRDGALTRPGWPVTALPPSCRSEPPCT